LGDKGVGFRDQHLGQHSAGAFTCNVGQGIVDSFRLTERDDGGISRHGVSLLSGGSGRLDTRLDTPPSIKRRHPDSRIAPAGALQGLTLLAFVLLVVLSSFYLLSNRPTRIRQDPIIANEPSSERGDLPEAAKRQTPPSISVEQWYYAETDECVGPFAAQELKQRLAASAQRWDMLVWRPGLSGWTRAGDVPEFRAQTDPPPARGRSAQADDAQQKARQRRAVARPRNDNSRESLKDSMWGIVGILAVLVIIIWAYSDQNPAALSTTPRDEERHSDG
jgi:hypothetical protein